MRTTILAAWLALSASCSDDTTITPDPTSGTTQNGTGAGNEGAGSTGLGYENGTRLQARVVRGADGSSQFLGWRDTELDLNCQFRRASDGLMRCLPERTVDVGQAFGDDSCTEPAAFATCGPFEGFVAGPTDDPCGGSAVYRVGQQPAVVYDAGCSELTSQTRGWVTLTLEPPETFVAGEVD